jgi:hypothetical protein
MDCPISLSPDLPTVSPLSQIAYIQTTSTQAQSSAITLTPAAVDMALPPEQTYESLAALQKSINDFASTRGYAFIKGRSKRTPGSNRLKLHFSCDRLYKPNQNLSREQQSRSRGTGCRFSVLACETICQTKWELKHRDYKQFGTHNHGPSSHPAAHSVHRRMPIESQAISQALYDSG